ncbi:YchJ family protein [Soonwooa sp.]|uniref:YchJ family protein n=1 Tax=Soonwooa sp. TaxID=1938592 RepID=UPI0028A6C52E|nr:YchJ family protein [Soonwooa sp.]
MTCPCCSGKTYEECCQPFHKRDKTASTAEALMRSRFSAFAIPNADYLWETTLSSKRKFHDKAELQEWGEINTWTKLEIIKTPALNQVEFKAYYTDQDGNSQIHHEFSYFQPVKGRWYYVSGEFMDD